MFIEKFFRLLFPSVLLSFQQVTVETFKKVRLKERDLVSEEIKQQWKNYSKKSKRFKNIFTVDTRTKAHQTWTGWRCANPVYHNFLASMYMLNISSNSRRSL